ncbi:MAG TPA: hypothetical protein VKP65_13415 [Rhodothermales bacterium]|nr:hypothetical protein [Rhodothermales bacterium]
MRRFIPCAKDEAEAILDTIHQNAKDSTMGGSWDSSRHVSGSVITAIWRRSNPQGVEVTSNYFTSEASINEYLPAEYRS